MDGTLGSFLNLAHLACMSKFKIEPNCVAVKVMPLTKKSQKLKMSKILSPGDI